MKKVLVISGGSRGIGLATAELFSRHGFTIVNLSRSKIALTGAQQMTADFTSEQWPESIAEPLNRALQDSQQIVLVHNAAQLGSGGVDDLDPVILRQSIEVNVVAPAILNKLVIPHMQPGSAIIYMGSTLSEKAVAGSACYVTGKHAVAGLMRSTCQDMAGTGIHTACVCPGFTDTEMLRDHVGNDKGILASIAEGVTQQRLIAPQEIAETVYFCANNPVVNGAVMHANLGQIER